MPTSPVVTRFAPSPTGHLHIGGARSALFCWAYAKRHAGRFMLRIEDTDAARSSDESARGIMEDLAWLGIDWDDGPSFTTGTTPPRTIAAHARPIEGGYFQARRVAIYNREIERLVRLGRAYPAFDTQEETEAQRAAAAAAKQTYRYPRPADIQPGVFNEPRWARAQAGERHVVRFVAPHEEITVRDEILGDVRIAPGELDDFVIRKADGFPTYHFAVVVDDQAMGVTHVLRAQEHLANTPRHVALQRALGYATPVYGHMPIICNMDGSKMSKRDKAKAARAYLLDRTDAKKSLTRADAARDLNVPEADLAAFLAKEHDSAELAARVARVYAIALPEIEVADFRASGYLPAAICNYLALLGWNPGLKTADGKDLEKFDMPFLASHFALDRVGKAPSKFDRNKLLSFNADAIAAMPDDEFARAWLAWMTDASTHDPDALASLAPVADVLRDAARAPWLVRAVKGRAKTLRGAVDSCRAWLTRADDATDFDPASVEKHLRADNARGLALLRDCRERLAGADPFDPPTIDAIIKALAAEHALPNPGPIAQGVRIAVAGVPVTPGLGETLGVLGKTRTLARLDRCLGTLGA